MIPSADIDRARSRLAEVIGAEVALTRKGSELAGLCPFHQEKSPSFYVSPDKGFFHCFGCGAHGTVIDFVMRRRNLDFLGAVRWLIEMPEVSAKHLDRQSVGRAPRETDGQISERVTAILRECCPAAVGTAAWLYLMSRGLKPDQPTLCAHPGLYCHEVGKPLPALVAPITDSGGEVCAVQRIWCCDRIETVNGAGPQDARAALVVRKKTLGGMRDGAVRMAPAGVVLGLAEGVETAIAASMLFRLPVWAVCGAARLGHVWIPPEVRMVWIMGDRGATGEELAQRAAEVWRESGIAAEAVFPTEGYGDFNDQLIGRRSV